MDDNDLQYFLGDDSQMVASNVYVSAESYTSANDKHNENVSKHLSKSGPVGIAAAAAISSCRYLKSSFLFEVDPVIRRRLQTKLLRKIRSTMDEYSCRIGQQIAMLNCTPSSKLPLAQQFKIYGSKKIEQALKSQRSEIMMELEKYLANKIEVENFNKNRIRSETGPNELPALSVEGIPTPLDKMTQSQLRSFIPEMLKLSTGRVKPGWRRIEFCPVWWPADVPWANIRTDSRMESERNIMSWTTCLRSIVLSCYQYHNCEHLLPDFYTNLNSREELIRECPAPVADITTELNCLENIGEGNVITGEINCMEEENVTYEEAVEVMSNTIGGLQRNELIMTSCESIVIDDTLTELQSLGQKSFIISNVERTSPYVSKMKFTRLENLKEYKNMEMNGNEEITSGDFGKAVFVSAGNQYLKKDSRIVEDISLVSKVSKLLKSEKEKSEEVVDSGVNAETNLVPDNGTSLNESFTNDKNRCSLKTFNKFVSPNNTPLCYIKMNDDGSLPAAYINRNKCDYRLIKTSNNSSSLMIAGEDSSCEWTSGEKINSINLLSNRNALDTKTDKNTHEINDIDVDINNSLEISACSYIANKYKIVSNINKPNNFLPYTGNKLVLAGKNLTNICLNNTV